MKMKAEDLKWNEREMLDENYQSLRQSRADMVDVKALVLHEEVVACPVEELRYRLTEAEALATQIDKSVGYYGGDHEDRGSSCREKSFRFTENTRRAGAIEMKRRVLGAIIIFFPLPLFAILQVHFFLHHHTEMAI